jgi:SAM-dependent methyltransferase
MVAYDMKNLDDPERISEIRALILKKPALKQFYVEVYEKFKTCLLQCPRDGQALELGSGGGFLKDFLPGIITSDVIPYAGVDRVVDATAMPFADDGLRFICMLNTLHHISDAELFLKEVNRCLKVGGRLFMVDQHPGWIAYPILKWGHHEPFDPASKDWTFESSSYLGSANGALSWIIFQRDRARFERLFPKLRIKRYEPHSALKYWLAGGLKRWSLVPKPLVPLVTWSDQLLCKVSRQLGSFADIELEKLS